MEMFHKLKAVAKVKKKKIIIILDPKQPKIYGAEYVGCLLTAVVIFFLKISNEIGFKRLVMNKSYQ